MCKGDIIENENKEEEKQYLMLQMNLPDDTEAMSADTCGKFELNKFIAMLCYIIIVI